MKSCEGSILDDIPGWYRWAVRAIFVGCIAFSYLANCIDLSSDHTMCRAMVNNVFLAYLPVEMSFHVSSKSRVLAFWGIAVGWMLFYPNAPYVLTDYFHLAHVDPYVVMENGKCVRIVRPDLRLWITFTVLSVGAIASVVFGIWSLDQMVGKLQARVRLYGPWWQVPLVTAFAALASVGIYLGRFPRLHSVHVLTRPRHALDQMLAACSMNMLEFVVLLTLIQVVMWLCLKLLRMLYLCRDFSSRS